MFEKIINAFIVKNEDKKRITVISAKREIKHNDSAMIHNVKSFRDDAFWDNRGKCYGALFTSINGRIF